jgi:hypothetical protein
MLQGAHQVTLLTGDVVSLRRLAGGKPGVAVEPAARPDGRTAGFRISTVNQDTYVLPTDVARLVPPCWISSCST